MKLFHTHFDDVWDLLEEGIPSNLKANVCSMPSFPHSNVWLSPDMNKLSVEFALAGYEEKEISVVASNNTITVVANPTVTEHQVVVVHQGLSRRKVDFSVAIDKAFDARKAKTSFKNGILRIDMTKTEENLSIKLM